MTRAEFEALMDAEGWTPLQRSLWAGFTPLGTADEFRRERLKPDGLINVAQVKRPRFEWLKRVYSVIDHLRPTRTPARS